MALMPTLRQKKRYVAFEILSPEKFTAEEIKDTIEKAILQFLGEFGASKASPIFIKERFNYPHFVLKVNHTSVDEIKAAIIVIKKIKNTPLIIKSVITSGTLKKVGSVLHKK